MRDLTPDAAMQLAIRHHQSGELSQAEQLYRLVLQQQPNHGKALELLGVVAAQTGRRDIAESLLRRAVSVDPSSADAWNNLGSILLENGKSADGLAAFKTSIALRPDHPDAHGNLASAIFREQGQTALAIEHFSKAIALNSALAGVHSNFGNLLTEIGQLDQAIAVLRRAIELDPNFAAAHHNLGLALRDAGLLDEAMQSFDRAIALNPAEAAFASSRLYAMRFHDGFGPRAIYEEHRKWNERFAKPLAKDAKPYSHSLDPDRPLRIGYVSADFRLHPVGRLLEPWLGQKIDRQQVFCYSGVRIPDEMTERLRAKADGWREVAGLSDEALAGQIRLDGVDILVDLSLHAAGGRLGVFARKPAPLQVTWLGYPSTTGLDAIDYRITDRYLDPPESNADPFYSERSVYLPRTYWCYSPGIAAPPAASPPAAANGFITFGCLNMPAKVSPSALFTFGKVLSQNPDSRLLLHAKDGSHRRRIVMAFCQQGIDESRIGFVGNLSLPDYFRTYDRIDIALDPFPCAGGVTTCDALWMGLPVITLAGASAVGRTGVTVLSNIDLPDFIATTADQYVHLAASLASDKTRLTELRGSLRESMLNSPLMDSAQFAKDMAALYREIWRAWTRLRQSDRPE